MQNTKTQQAILLMREDLPKYREQFASLSMPMHLQG